MSEREQAYYRNLPDAGCSEKSAMQCISLLQGGKRGELFGFLAEYRDELLLKLHLCQRQIDCLDYFIYRIRKENKDNTVTGKSV